MCETLISANITLNKLGNLKFKTFLEIYTKNLILSKSTLRKGYVDDIYNKTKEKLQTKNFGLVSIRQPIQRVVTLQSLYCITFDKNYEVNIFLLNLDE